MPRIGTMEESEAKKVHDIDGYLVETDSMVRLLTGIESFAALVLKVLLHPRTFDILFAFGA